MAYDEKDANSNSAVDEKSTLERAVAKLEAAKSIPSDLRCRMKMILGKPRDKEELIYLCGLKNQYEWSIESLVNYGFLTKEGEANEGDVPAPSFEKLMDTFSPNELEIAIRFKRQTLLLIPETSFAAKIEALNAVGHKERGSDICSMNSNFEADPDSGSSKITGWRAAIVEGDEEMDVYEGDRPSLRINARIAIRKVSREPGERGMGRHAYAMLWMRTFREGRLIDQKTMTLLDDDMDMSICIDAFGDGTPKGKMNNSLPDGSLDESRCVVRRACYVKINREVRFMSSVADDVREEARFRSSVGGNVLIV